jgi:hypothetical protein
VCQEHGNPSETVSENPSEENQGERVIFLWAFISIAMERTVREKRRGPADERTPGPKL